LAARILWLAIKVEWEKGIGGLLQQWVGFKKAFTDIWAEASHIIATGFIVGLSIIEQDFLKKLSAIKTAWAGVVAAMQLGWSTIQHAAELAMIAISDAYDTTLGNIARRLADLAGFSGAVELVTNIRHKFGTKSTEDSEQKRIDARRKFEERSAGILDTFKGTQTAGDDQLEQQKQRQAGRLFTLEEDHQRSRLDRRRQFDDEIAALSGNVAKAQAELAAAIGGAAKARRDVEKATAAAGGGPLAAGGPGAAGGGLAVSAAPLGVALTATYSAAAARIAGFQPGGGPEKKMADGITEVAKNTREMTQLQQEFLAGQRIA
jgi:hypothetical protein